MTLKIGKSLNNTPINSNESPTYQLTVFSLLNLWVREIEKNSTQRLVN